MPDATGHGQIIKQLLALCLALTRRWRLVASIAAAMCALGIVYIMVTPARYSASAMVLINSKTFSGQRDASGASMDMAAMSTYLESQVEILKSERILRQIVESENLVNNSFLQPGRANATIARIFSVLGRQPEAEREARRMLGTIRALQSTSKVRRLTNTHLVEIEVTLGDPISATRVANSYAQTYVEDQRRLREDLLKQSTDALGTRAKELREQARSAEEAVERFKFLSVTQGKDGADTRVMLKDLESQARTFRIIHDKFLERYAEALQQQQSVVPDAQLISAALPPLGKRWPITSLVLAIALLLSVVVSTIWILLTEWLASQLREQDAHNPIDRLNAEPASGVERWLHSTLAPRRPHAAAE